MNSGSSPVLVLGAGINGCALARELALNGVSVWLVDSADIASGATAYSSRLIHGGLRYLEYGEFDLVKESLAERTRLLQLAPQFVRPLKLWIPAASRLGGLTSAIGKFFSWPWWPAPVPKTGRGVTLIRAGLALYDAYARDPHLPKHACMPVSDAGALAVNPKKYHWLCSYYDAQVAFPERLVLALLEDARQVSFHDGLDFRVFTYHQATLSGDTVEISPLAPHAGQTATCRVKPAVIVNATGAWVDETLRRLHVESVRLMGGTKGSHLFTFHPRLRERLSGQGIYAEARDGRPIFITPLAQAVLIGTTDEPFEGPPERALATDRELDYLLEAVNSILPDVSLERSDIAFHYSAVRPLAHVSATNPAAITRRHAVIRHDTASVPLFSLVGGKLTTMRSLAEITAAEVLQQLARPVTANSRARLVPGAENYPAEQAAVAEVWDSIAGRLGYKCSTIAAVWQLCGTRSEAILASSDDRALLDGTDLPCSLARWTIQHEYARTLADLVERRLMLLYHQDLTKACLDRLAVLLAEAGHLPPEQLTAAVADEIARLQARYGKRVA
jgi:glycerol-3-phosphate dehydrogenase